MMRKLILLSCIFFVPLILNAQERSLSIEEAIQIALENNYQLKQAKNNLEFSNTEILSAKADYLPSLNGGFNGNRSTGLDFIPEDLAFEDRTRSSISGSLNANLTIFDGFRNIMNLRRARAIRATQDEDFQRLRESVIFNTASRFLRVVLDQELLRIAESTQEASQSQLEQIRAQVEVGARPTVDLYNQEAVVANDELAVIQRETALEFSKAQLIRVMQDETIMDIEIIMPSVDEQALFPEVLDLQEMIEIAMQNRSDFRAQEFLIESNRNNVRLAQANLMPSINANANISGNYSDQLRDPITGGSLDFFDQFLDRNMRRSFGFSIQIPIFNRWNTQTSIESAQVQLRNSMLELDNIRFQINEEVRQAYNDYISISKELESTEKALIAAERAYETELQRYEVGASTLIELNLANATYVQAQSNRIQTIYNFVFQEKVLDYFIGQLETGMGFN